MTDPRYIVPNASRATEHTLREADPAFRKSTHGTKTRASRRAPLEGTTERTTRVPATAWVSFSTGPEDSDSLTYNRKPGGSRRAHARTA